MFFTASGHYIKTNLDTSTFSKNIAAGRNYGVIRGDDAHKSKGIWDSIFKLLSLNYSVIIASIITPLAGDPWKLCWQNRITITYIPEKCKSAPMVIIMIKTTSALGEFTRSTPVASVASMFYNCPNVSAYVLLSNWPFMSFFIFYFQLKIPIR